MSFSRYEGQLHDANADDLAISEQPEHRGDGTRLHEDADGTEYLVAVCLCGQRFVEPSELAKHIAEEAE